MTEESVGGTKVHEGWRVRVFGGTKAHEGCGGERTWGYVKMRKDYSSCRREGIRRVIRRVKKQRVEKQFLPNTGFLFFPDLLGEKRSEDESQLGRFRCST